MCHFKAAHLKEVSHKAEPSQETHSAVGGEPVKRRWAAVTQSLINARLPHRSKVSLGATAEVVNLMYGKPLAGLNI